MNAYTKRVAARVAFSLLLTLCGAHGALAQTADKSAVKPSVLSLPSGPGSIEGLGEAFQPQLNSGTASYSVPLKVPPGRAGFQPSLALQYSSGQGSGVFGLGWKISLPYIQRQTDKALPRYRDVPGTAVDYADADRFADWTAEDLVHVGGDTYRKERESDFMRYTRVENGWEGRRQDGVRMWFGTTETARIEDGTGRVFRWLIDRMEDPNGNAIEFTYAALDNTRQRYCTRIDFNRPAGGGEGMAVVFEHAQRPDPILDYRPTFLLATRFRCENIVMTESGAPVWTYRLTYGATSDTQPHSLLTSVTQVGRDGTSELPPASFSYTAFSTAAAESKRFSGAPELGFGPNGGELFDVNGDGLADLINTQDTLHDYYLNLGPDESGQVTWDSRRVMPGSFTPPGLASPDTQTADLDGDAVSELLVLSGNDILCYVLKGADTARGWDFDRLYPVTPFTFNDPNVRLVDLNGDRKTDVLRTDPSDLVAWFSNANDTWSEAEISASPAPGLQFESGELQLADMNGDRLQDLVQLQNDVLIYYPNMGYGRFGSEVAFTSTPFGANSPTDYRLLDVNGDGLSDPVRVTNGEVVVWLNLGPNPTDLAEARLASPYTVNGPISDQNTQLRDVDINGNGSTDLLWNTYPTGGADLFAFVDFSPEEQPYQLKTITNGIGLTTTLHYRSTTKYLIADRDGQDGVPWTTKLPKPMSVLGGLSVSDGINAPYETTFHYRDPYYDTERIEFRGFGAAEMYEIGDDSAPTLATVHEFHTGFQEPDVLKGKPIRVESREMTNDGPIYHVDTFEFTVTDLLDGQGGDPRKVSFAPETRNTREILEKGNGDPVTVETTTEYEYAPGDEDGTGGAIARTIKTEFGRQDGAFDDERRTETVFSAAFPTGLDPAIWILDQVVEKIVTDETGSSTVNHQRNYFDELPLGEIAKGNLTLTEDWVSEAYFVQSVRNDYDEHGNIVAQYDPLYGTAPGHFREFVYDSAYETFLEQEIIHTGGTPATLIMSATYDPGWGVMTSSTEYNNNTTSYQYDTFGRLVGIVKPGDTQQSPTAAYAYFLAQPISGGGLVNYVETRLLDGPVGSGQYFNSRTFIDGLGREVMTKEEAGNGQFAVKGAVLFNARRQKSFALQPFFSNSFDFEDVMAPGWSGTFHENGALVTLGLSAAHGTAFDYDATVREIRAINPDGTVRDTVYQPLTTWSYDENDTDTNSPYHDTPMVHHNDGLGRLARVDERVRLNDDGTPAGEVKTWITRYAYREDDLLTRITDSQNNQKWMEYDGLGRKVFMNDMDRGVMTYFYDDASNLIETVDAKGQHIVYSYDGVNRLLTEDYQDNGTPASFNRAIDVAYHYDVPAGALDLGNGDSETATQTKGFLAWVEDLSGEEHLSYDSRGRARWTVKRIPDPVSGVMESFKTEMEYDSADRVTALVYPDEDRGTFTYNARNLLGTIGGGAAHNLGGNPNILGDIDYTPSGQLDRASYGNGVRTTYTYDKRLRMNALDTAPLSAPANPLIAYDYTFDGASNITRIDDRRPGTARPEGDPRRNTQVFHYDDLYRLTNVQYSFNLPGQALRDDGQIAYRYDRIGNMLSSVSGIDQEERGLSVTNIGAMSYGGGLGASGRVGRTTADPGPHALTAADNGEDARAYPYDANGNMTNIDGLECTWDFKDRLRFVENDEMRAEYIYDYTDRRIAKKVWNKPAAKQGRRSAEAETSDEVAVPAFSKGVGDRPSLTTQYINRYFEIREYEQPTKYVWNGETRVAKVTGSLDSTAQRVQRFRVNAGWNLVALLVEAEDAAAQLGIGNKTQIANALRWKADEKTFVSINGGEALPAGSILWLNVQAAGVLRVKGSYEGDVPQVLTGTGDFIHAGGLYTRELAESLNGFGKVAWSLERNAGEEVWQLVRGLGEATQGTGSLLLEPGRSLFVQGVTELDTGEESSGQIQYYHQDHLGSSNVLAGSDGEVAAENVFYAFGTPRKSGETDTAGRSKAKYLFTQKERDEESGMQYFEARYLFSYLGRFVSPDPFSTKNTSSYFLEQPRRTNSYSYSENAPIVVVDPSGEVPLLLAIALAFAIDSLTNSQYANAPESSDAPTYTLTPTEQTIGTVTNVAFAPGFKLGAKAVGATGTLAKTSAPAMKTAIQSKGISLANKSGALKSKAFSITNRASSTVKRGLETTGKHLESAGKGVKGTISNAALKSGTKNTLNSAFGNSDKTNACDPMPESGTSLNSGASEYPQSETSGATNDAKQD